MHVSLREITPENFQDCVDLKVSDNQKGFVADNVYSIAQSKIFPHYNVRAVYADETLVGFVMFGPDETDGKYYLGRLMIDETQQGKGFGKAATLAVLEEMKKTGECDEVFLSFVPENSKARRLYESIGFVPTAELNGNEIVMRFAL